MPVQVLQAEPAWQPVRVQVQVREQVLLTIPGKVREQEPAPAQEQLQDGDIVLDMDRIRSSLMGTDAEHQDNPELTHIMQMIRWAVYKGVEEGDIAGKAYLITSETNRARLDQWA